MSPDSANSPHRRRQLARGAASLAVVFGLLSACGGSKTASKATTTVAPATTTTTPVATSDTTPVTAAVGDDAKALPALITLADLPTGWTAAPGGATSNDGPPDSDDAALNVSVASCVGLSAAPLNVSSPEEDSPTFTGPDGASTIDDSVDIEPTAADAQAAIAIYRSPRAPACLAAQINGPSRATFNQQLQAGEKLVSAAPVAASIPRLGDGSADIELHIVITYQGVDDDVFIDQISLVRGRSETSLNITEPGAFALQALAVKLSTDAANRMTP